MLSRVKRVTERKLTSLAKRLPPHPNAYTLAALAVSLPVPLVPMYLSFRSSCMVMLVLLLISSLLDMVDGLVARTHGRVSKLGAFLDSTCDRIADFLFIFGLYLLLKDDMCRIMLLTLLFGSNLVSYARARAESLGVTTMSGVGLMERPERIIAEVMFLIMLMLTPSRLMTYLARTYLAVFMILTLITAIHRCVIAVRLLRTKA